MSRLIDADALKTTICLSVCSYNQAQLCTCGCAQILAIDNAPTIEPVRHGHWVTKTRHEHYPSGKEYEEDYCSACGMRGSIEYDYCPHCGARMNEVIE